MKNTYVKLIAIFTFITIFAIASFSQTETPTTETNQNKVRVGVTLPKAAFTGEGVDNVQMAAGNPRTRRTVSARLEHRNRPARCQTRVDNSIGS